MITRHPVRLAAILILVGSPEALPAQSDALSLSEVLDLHRRGVSTRQILRNVKDYCIAFTVTDSVDRELAASGADTALAGGLRRACVVKTAPPLPPGVLIDDDFQSAGRFAVADQLCVARPDARGMRVENGRPAASCAIAYPLNLVDGDIRLELTVAELRGDPRAVVVLGFGKDSVSWDQYTFAITADGYVELGEMTRGRFRQLRYLKPAAAIEAGSSSENTMAVDIRGRAVDLYLNETRVLTYQADRDLAHGVSLGLGPRSRVVFTRLRVKKHGVVASAP